MLSALAQGCGAWDGSTSSHRSGFPAINIASEHRHGVTVKSARRKKTSIIRVEEVDGPLPMPKTYLTRKGALVLYTSKQSATLENTAKPIDVEKVIQRLGNVRRLMASVLYLNDGQMADADISVSDERNEVFVGFIKTIDSVLYKQKIQPGHDLSFYLRTLRMRARNLSALAGSELAQEINALLCTLVTTSRPSTSGTNATAASHKLSSAKLTASLKSGSYMGRKIAYPALDPTIYNFANADTPYSSTTWPGYSQLHETAGTDKISPRISRPATASGGRESKRSTLSVADGGDGSKARSFSAISTNTSGSLADDPTLFEEMDVLVAAGLEVDSDLENEYFQSVLNADDFPSRGDNKLGKRRRPSPSSASNRNLTNTPDVERSLIGVEVKDNAPITPEITLRSGASDMFSIAQSQIDDENVSFPASSDKELSLDQHESIPHSPRFLNATDLGDSAKQSEGEGQHSASSASTSSDAPSDQMNNIMYVEVTPNQNVSINDLPRLVPKEHSKLNNNAEKTTPESMSGSKLTEQRAGRRDSSTEDSRRSSSALATLTSASEGSLQLPAIAEGNSRSPPRPQTAKVTTAPFVNITHLPVEKAASIQKSPAFTPRHVAEKPKTPKVRDADKEALKKEEKLREDEQKALEVLMKDPKEVKEMLASNMMEDFDEGGLTLEEMELAREMLDQKLAEAEKGIEQQLSARKPSDKSNNKSKGSSSKSTESELKDLSKEIRKELMEKRERVRQAKKLAQQRRMAEKKALQEMILAKTKEEQAFLAEEERRIKEIMERERYMNAIAEEARQQEEEARLALAKSRRQAKAEREQRRKEELERRKEEAIRRREEQKRMQDSARQKELDMLEQISDAETVRHLREQERKRKEEEEWKLQAKLMEDERLSSLQAEDEEVRIANIEREAEESAMARMVEERMEAERKEREIEQQRRELQELENERRAYLEREKQKIEEELRRQEEEEEREREAERLRVLELKRMEEEAREQMLKDIEARRAQLMRLRELNIEKKRNLETIKKNQAYTKPWVFSYYVKWPRETYEKLMGGDDKKRRPVPRKKEAGKA